MADPLANLVAAPAVGYSGQFGGIPQVPNPIATQTQAIGGNIGNLGGLYNLAGPANQFNQGQAALGLQTNLPGYQGMIGQSSQNIASQLQGKLPQDVINQIAQQAAERGAAMGVSNSPNANAAYLRALGLNSAQLQQQGEQNLTNAIGRTPTARNFDPTQFFVTPEQQQQAQAAANLYGSAPIPSQAAMAARQAAGGVGGARPGGYQIVGGNGLPASPTTSSPSPGIYQGVNPGNGGLQYGGNTLYGGNTPLTAQNAWNQWYSTIQKNPYAPGSSTFGSFGAPTADDYDYLFGDNGGGMAFNDPFQSTAPISDNNYSLGGGSDYADWSDPLGLG